MGSPHHQRPRHEAGSRSAGECQYQSQSRPRQTHRNHRRHRQRQRRQLHGKHCRMARQSAQPRRVKQSLEGTRSRRPDPRRATLRPRPAISSRGRAQTDAKMPKFHRNYWWNAAENMKVQMKPTRLGFGQSLAANGDDPRIVCFGLDISGSITISEFYAGKPERKSRWISMGIAEQSATSAAAGLAKEGKLPVFGTYATFAAARNLDQIRTSICYGNFNVLIAGAHGGVSVGPDGATHQALEDC